MALSPACEDIFFIGGRVTTADRGAMYGEAIGDLKREIEST